jgi:hypothetical protein
LIAKFAPETRQRGSFESGEVDGADVIAMSSYGSALISSSSAWSRLLITWLCSARYVLRVPVSNS